MSISCNLHLLRYSLLLLGGALCLASCSESSERIRVASEEAFVKLHGSGYGQITSGLLQTDQGFLLAGVTNLTPDGETGQQVYLVETDKGGNHLRTYAQEVEGMKGLKVSAMKEATNGDLLLCGTGFLEDGSSNAWAMRRTADFVEVWQQSYGDSSTDEFGADIVETDDGAIYLLGSTSKVDPLKAEGNTPATDVLDVYLVKIDANNGDADWSRAYGYTGQDWGVGLAKLDGGELAILGTTEYPENGFLDTDILLILLHPDGNPYNTQTFGEPTQDEIATSLTYSPNQIAITGGYGQETLFLLLDQQLQAIVDASAIPGISGPAIGNDVFSLDDNSFLIVGSGMNGEGEDVLLTKVDAAGNSIWTQYYGDQGDDMGAAVISLDDHSIAVAATIQFGSVSMMGLIKTQSDGSL